MKAGAHTDIAPTTRITRLWAGVMLLAAFAGVQSLALAQSARDPLEGKWLGTAGSEREKIVVGLEFQRDPQGKLVLRLTQPVSNYFGVDPGGEFQRKGDEVTHEGMALSLRLRGDELVGTYPGPNSPATLKRVDTLPSEQDPPAVPKGPEPRWQARLGGQVFAAPTVMDKVAFVGTTGGVFNAVKTDSGEFAWTYSTGAAIHGAATAVGDAVYFASDDGFLYKLARADGKLRWRYGLGDADVGRVLGHPHVYDWDWQGAQPLVADGVVYIGAGDGGFHAVDAETGARKWRFYSGGKIRNGAALDGDRIVFGSHDHHVYALERASGKEVWRHDTKAAIDSTPVVHAGRVLVGNRGGGLYSLAAQTGELQWRQFFWGSWVESTPVIVDGTLYMGSSDLRRVSAINPDNGHVLWRSDVYGWSFGTPLVLGNRLYVGAAGGTPYFVRHLASFNTLDRKTGRILTRWPMADTGAHQWGIAGSPALAGDTVVVASMSGSLYGFPVQGD